MQRGEEMQNENVAAHKKSVFTITGSYAVPNQSANGRIALSRQPLDSPMTITDVAAAERKAVTFTNPG